MLSYLCEGNQAPLKLFKVSLTGHLELHLSGFGDQILSPAGNMAVCPSTTVPEGALSRTLALLLPTHLLPTLCTHGDLVKW